VVVRSDEPLERVPMSWDQYLKLPERPRAEWVNGVAVIMNAPVSFGHGDSAVRLGAALAHALPELFVVTEVRLWVAEDVLRVPDIMVTDARPRNDWAVSLSEPPLMVAEVLSASTRSEDLIVKASEYAAAGIGQYWILDPEQRTLEVMRNVEGAWHRLVMLDDDNPEATVVLAGRAVSVDLRLILRF
jgi:Uma2 family endonuclease